MKIVLTPGLLLECIASNPTKAEFCELVRSKTNSDISDGIIIARVTANIQRLSTLGFPTKEGRKTNNGQKNPILPKFKIEREGDVVMNWEDETN